MTSLFSLVKFIFCLFATSFYRAMLCIRGTSHGPVSVRPSACPSVTSRSSTRMVKLRITKQHHTIVQGLSFSEAKDLHEIRPGHPPWGHQMQVGWIKIGDFRVDKQPAISRKRYKIDAWFLLKSNRKSYALYRMVTLPMTLSAP